MMARERRKRRDLCRQFKAGDVVKAVHFGGYGGWYAVVVRANDLSLTVLMTHDAFGRPRQDVEQRAWNPATFETGHKLPAKLSPAVRSALDGAGVRADG